MKGFPPQNQKKKALDQTHYVKFFYKNEIQVKEMVSLTSESASIEKRSLRCTHTHLGTRPMQVQSHLPARQLEFFARIYGMRCIAIFFNHLDQKLDMQWTTEVSAIFFLVDVHLVRTQSFVMLVPIHRWLTIHGQKVRPIKPESCCCIRNDSAVKASAPWICGRPLRRIEILQRHLVKPWLVPDIERRSSSLPSENG
jgi:hypothetical protein